MSAFVLIAVLAAAPATPPPAQVSAHGITVVAPEGWVPSKEGTTTIFSSPGKDASLRVDLFEKEKVGDPTDCLDQLTTNLSTADKVSKDTYTQGAIDSQPSATQVTFTQDRQHRQKRLVGCNGKSYFLIDWVELTHAGPKYDKTFSKLLTGIKYAPAK